MLFSEAMISRLMRYPDRQTRTVSIRGSTSHCLEVSSYTLTKDRTATNGRVLVTGSRPSGLELSASTCAFARARVAWLVVVLLVVADVCGGMLADAWWMAWWMAW